MDGELVEDFMRACQGWHELSSGSRPQWGSYAAGWYAARAGIPCPPQGQRGPSYTSFSRGYGDGAKRNLGVT